MENKTSKYLKYAIGEIVLVVVGILIALQINNWNEQRKEDKMGLQFLKGIQSDLEKDIILIDSVLKVNKQCFSLISSIDSVFHKKKIYESEKHSDLFGRPDTLNFDLLFHRNISFRSINGTYKSIISDGKSSLIKNRQLFQRIQQIYDENHERLSSTYEVIKNIEARINWEYSIEKQHWTYSDLKRAKDKKVFTDLVNFTEDKYWYALNLERIKRNGQEVILLIEKELSND